MLGDLVPRDDKKAFKYYEQSASGRYIRANHYMAVCFLNGLGCEKILESARTNFEIASKNGYEPGVQALKELDNYES